MKVFKFWVHTALLLSLIIAQAPAAARSTGSRQSVLEQETFQQGALPSTAFSGTRQEPDGGLSTVITPQAQNYLDRQGNWQAIDAQFQPQQDSFVVEKNAIQTTAGNRRVWFSALVGDLLFGYETLDVGSASAGGDFRALAAPLPQPPPAAVRRSGNLELVYEHAWQDQRLSEILTSAPGSLEHSLLLEQPIERPDGQAEFLELRARLSLLEGAVLLADGKPAAAGRTARSLQLQDARGQTVLQFEPVVSYEQGNRAARVEGAYRLEPGEKPGEWIIAIRTPFSWLSAPERRYPMVIDPLMRVLIPTGYAKGAAWISDTNNQFTFEPLVLGAHSPLYSSLSRGYFQFRDLPAALTNAAALGSVMVKKATLEISVSDIFIPEYYDSPVDWDEKVIKRKATLSYLGDCPGDCSGFTLHDNSLLGGPFDWATSPAGAPVFSVADQSLAFGPAKGKPKTHVTTWDVTKEISDWYDTYFTNQQDHWPVFSLKLNEICPQPGPYYRFIAALDPQKWVTSYLHVPACTHFIIPPENIKLTIEYDPLPLALDANLLNQPGVPSYLPEVLQDTAHQLQLATYNPAATGGPHWRTVAVRGNHDYIAGPDTTSVLQLLQAASSAKLGSSSSLGANSTAALFIDDHAIPSLPGADLLAAVPPSNQNEYGADLQRNYRLEYKMAVLRPVSQQGVWINISPLEDFYSNQLVKLVEFEVNPGDNFTLKASAPDDVQVLLIPPQPAAALDEAVVGFSSSRVLSVSPEGQNGPGSRFVPISPAGRWALAFINHGPAVECVGPDCDPGGATKIGVEALIRACPGDSVPTGDYECQVIQLADAGDQIREVDLPGTTNDLIVFSEAPFQNFANGWCTDNEATGTPALQREFPTNQRAVIVANGRVCYLDGQLFTASRFSSDPATSRAAVSIARPKPGTDPNAPRGILGTDFIYGSPGKTASDPADKTGQFSLDAGGNLEPTPQTLVNIQLFGMYWKQATLATNLYEIDSLSTKLVANESLSTQVSADLDQPALPAGWQVAWELYPSSPPYVGGRNYTFTSQVTQTTLLPLEIPLASMTLRLVSSGTADGLLPYLDAWHKLTAPSAYQFITPEARITLDPRLGEASQKVQAVVLPSGLPRPPDDVDTCDDGGTLTACLDVRAYSYAFNPVGVKDAPAAWSLPDIHIEDSLGSVVFSQVGALSVYSADHPLSPQNFAQAFNFDTWGAKVTVASAPCNPGEPVTTITKGEGYISLPGIVSDGSSDPGSWIKIKFELCETNLRQAQLTLDIEPGAVPVGNSGLGVGLVGGTVTVGPDYTEVVIDVHFRSLDGSLFNDGEGQVTINSAGMFDLQGSGNLIGYVRADTLELQVAWNPLDILFQGEVSCCGNLIEGYMNMHGWMGKGWQNQYAWITDNKFHFTGSIGGRVGLETGDLINKKFFKIPPFDIFITATIAFGDFCSAPGCSSQEWGMSASISVFGYPAGVYVSGGGPEIFLGSASKKLVDQYGGALLDGGLPKGALAPESSAPVNSNPAAQTLTIGYKSPFDGLIPEDGSLTCPTGTPGVYECSFNVPAGAGRALFLAAWLNGLLKVTLIKPDATVITPANAAANGVEISAPPPSPNGKLVSFSVKPTSGSLIPSGAWKVRLEQVAADSYFSLTFAADPPAPSVMWSNPVSPGVTPGGGGLLNLQWTATRGGAALSDDVRAELFYAPVLQTRTFPSLVVSFPGSYQSAAGLGADWDPAAPAILAQDANGDGVWKLETASLPAGSYTFKAALNGSWQENYGLDGLRDGPDIPLTQTVSGGPLSFYYDSSDDTLAAHPQDDLPVLVGDMLSEIGGADWAPANLVGWLKPASDAGLSELALHLPEGNWLYKVALNESWAVNYGAGGILDGDDIPLTVPDGGGLVRFTYDAATHVITHTLLAPASGAPLVGKLKANLDSYAWDTRGLAAGEYQVGMRIEDTFRANGPVIAWAPGTVLISDSTPPPAPVYLSSKKLLDGLVVRWQRDDLTPDLAGYLIEYGIPDWSQNLALPKTLRLLPATKDLSPLYQAGRLGGLFGGLLPGNDVVFCIRAYDASGNLSDCDPISEQVPLDEGPPVSRVAGLALTPGPAAFTIAWDVPFASAPAAPTAAGYLVSYSPTGCILPAVQNLADEVPSPLDVPGPPALLSGLTVGQRYRVGVRAYDGTGDLSSEIFRSATFGDPADADDDLLPDSWEAAFGVGDPLLDDDLDGLDNLSEFNAGLFPDEPDSDRDGFYDGDELEQGSDPCGPGFPTKPPITSLAVVGSSELVFHIPANQPGGDPHSLTILNQGAGTMDWELLVSAPWLQVSQLSGQDDQALLLLADPSGLPVGVYSGTLTIQAHPAGGLAPTLFQESVTISIFLVVQPMKNLELFLPLARKS